MIENSEYIDMDLTDSRITRNTKYIRLTGSNYKHIVNMMDKIGDRLILVYDENRSKTGVSRSVGFHGRNAGKIIELVSWSSHIAIIEFKGVV